nr:5'-nucleotidase [Tumebacillus amylolyticus]
MNEWEERAAEELSSVVVDLEHEIGHHLIVNSPLGHLLSDGMRRLTGAEIALINGGMFNHGLLPGPFTRQDLLTCFPSPCLTCVVEITGAQLLSVLQKSLLPGFYEQVGKGYGFRGHFIGGLQVSGLQIQVEEVGLYLYDVQAVHEGGEIEPERWYSVAICDYLYFSPVFEEFKQARSVKFQLPFLRELLAKELTSVQLAEVEQPRWHFNGAAF